MIQSIIISMLLTSSTLWANEKGKRKQELTLYGWLPTLDARLTIKVPNEADETAEASIIDSLDSVIMGSYSLRQDEWSLFADFIYLKVSGDTEGLNPNVNLDLGLTTKLYSLYGGYNIIETASSDLNFIAGLRYLGLSLDIERRGGLIANGTLSASIDNYDAVMGLSGTQTFGENWYMPYQFDIGAGDSDLTYQARVGIAYKMSWGDIIATYRYIHYEKGDSLLIENYTIHGPKLGVVFHF